MVKANLIWEDMTITYDLIKFIENVYVEIVNENLIVNENSAWSKFKSARMVKLFFTDKIDIWFFFHKILFYSNN